MDWFQVDLVPSPSCRAPQKLCLRGIKSQAVRSHKCFDVSYAFNSAFTRPGLLSLIRTARDVELQVVRIVVRPNAVSGGG